MFLLLILYIILIYRIFAKISTAFSKPFEFVSYLDTKRYKYINVTVNTVFIYSPYFFLLHTVCRAHGGSRAPHHHHRIPRIHRPTRRYRSSCARSGCLWVRYIGMNE